MNKYAKPTEAQRKVHAPCRSYKELCELLKVPETTLCSYMLHYKAPKPVVWHKTSSGHSYQLNTFIKWWMSLAPEVRLKATGRLPTKQD